MWGGSGKVQDDRVGVKGGEAGVIWPAGSQESRDGQEGVGVGQDGVVGV
jgi:hypothetical protein